MKNPEKKATVSQDERNRKAERDRVAILWFNWKQRLINGKISHAAFGEELIKRLNQLAADILHGSKHKEFSQSAIDAIDYSISRVTAFEIFLNNTQMVTAVCPHSVRINAVETPCEWEGWMRVDKKKYEDGTITHACPKCGGNLTADNMTKYVKSDRPIEKPPGEE